MLYKTTRHARFEPQRQKTYLWTRTPSENSDQSAQSRSLIRTSLGALLRAEDATFLHADNEDSDHSARMRRLI